MSDDAQDLEQPEASADEAADPVSLDAVADTATEFLRGLLDSAGLDAEVTTRIEDDIVHADVSGEDLGVMIGRRGQTLDALQELTRTALQRKLQSRVRVQVDVEGYRARRKASLADYARSIAERAKERGTEIELEAMPAYERKIVHDAISEVEGASSFSEGEEPNRKVVVRGE